MIDPLNVAAPTSTLPSSLTGIERQVVLGLDASKNTKENVIRISFKAKPKKTKRREGKKLSMLEFEEIPATGACPGGVYHYITDKEILLKMLRHWIDSKAWVAIDLETGVAWRERVDEDGEILRVYEEVIDPHTCPIYLVSMSVEPGVAVVFDMRGFRHDSGFLSVWKEFLTTCKFVAHNSMFEQCFLAAHFEVVTNMVYDTMLVHQLMTAGLDTSSALGEMLERYCGIKLDKQWQSFFLSIDHRSPLPAECIAYSAGDVCQLLTLAKKLDQELKDSGLYDIWTQYEQPFMKWIALAKVEGIAIDRDYFKQLHGELTTEIDKTLVEFDTLCPGVLISSPLQVKNWFEKQGMKLRSTNVTALEKLKELPDIGKVAGVILHFRKLQKMRNTYIEPLIRTLCSPVTMKIHPNWGQLYTSTGRMNCNEPNFQNMPSRGEWVKIRNGFIAKPGHLLGYADYSQFEVRAMADMASEDRMISVFEEAETATKELNNYCEEHALPFKSDSLCSLAEKATDKTPERAEAAAKAKVIYDEIIANHPKIDGLVKRLAHLDFHRMTAALLFGVDVETVTKEQRTKAKTITFAKPYGAGPKKIAQAAGIEVDEAIALFKDYDVKFPRLAAFLEQCREQAKKGHTESPTGRRRFYQPPNFAELMRKVKMVAKAGGAEWDEMVETWGTTDVHDLTNKIFNAKIGAIEREGMNHPIQACNADATKLATVMAAPRLQQLDPECLIIAWVHDEIVLTAPEALVEEATQILRSSMIEAAQRLLLKTPVDVSISIGKCWGK